MTGELLFASLMADNAAPLCRGIAAYLTTCLGIPSRTIEDVPWQERERLLLRGRAHLGVVCGLQYVYAADAGDEPITLLAAPVMRGDRYLHRPIYYSDVIVRRDSTARSLTDLRGAAWAFNEPTSHSGYTLARSTLVERGETSAFFGRVVVAGSHQRSLAMVAEGAVDGAAIDSTVLEQEERTDPDVAQRIKVIEVLGPSPIPPLVVSRSVAEPTVRALRSAMLAMHRTPDGGATLAGAGIDRFVEVADTDYDPIRAMARAAEQAAAWPLVATPE